MIVRKKAFKGRNRGKFFYACDCYPKCNFAISGKPTGDRCKLCNSLIISNGKKEICSNKDCKSNEKKTKKVVKRKK